MDLHREHCVPCEGKAKPLGDEEVGKYLARLDKHWKLVDGKEIKAIFTFKDFKEAMSFVNNIAEIAEGQGHHPDISISYDTVTLTLSTHSIKGLSKNDFILAAKIDLLKL